MAQYKSMNKKELLSVENELLEQYNTFKEQNLALDMSRGKPSAEQLDLSNGLFGLVNDELGYTTAGGFDCRNYGILDGIPECKELFADLLNVSPDNIIIGGNASLNILFDYLSQCMIHGAVSEPWSKCENRKFICPVPGYDRHFDILTYFGFELVTVPLLSDGPDMDKVRELVKDESVKGMITVPKYSNPTGVTYSADVAKQIAQLKPACKEFRVLWDNAYCVHDLYEEGDVLPSILDLCKEAGNSDLVVEVMSTSKITFPGAGVAVLIASDNNVASIRKRMTMQTIGHDKLNQLRHVRFLKNAPHIHKHMDKQAALIRPKFEAVLGAFSRCFTGKDVATWSKPNGGYFISVDLMKGCAKQVVLLCKQAGVVLTPAGATYPHGVDPNDCNIRIAPTYPPLEELEKAVELFCICVELVSVQKLIAEL